MWDLVCGHFITLRIGSNSLDTYMECQIRTTVGSSEVTITGSNPMEVVDAISMFSEMPTACGNCHSTDVNFRVRRAKGEKGENYKYYAIKCNSCLHEFQLGQTSDGQRLFPKYKEGWKKWEPGDNDNSQAHRNSPPSPRASTGDANKTSHRPKSSDYSNEDVDDIPF
jgi:hypothetical protein